MALQTVTSGIPRGNQAEKLIAMFVESGGHAGTIFKHDDLAALIGVPHASTRYRSILTLARRLFLERYGIKFAAIPSVGLRIPTGDEQLKTSVNEVRIGFRKVRRAVDTASRIDDKRLLPEGRVRRNKIACEATGLVATMRTTHRLLAATLPDPLPQRPAPIE